MKLRDSGFEPLSKAVRPTLAIPAVLGRQVCTVRRPAEIVRYIL